MLVIHFPSLQLITSEMVSSTNSHHPLLILLLLPILTTVFTSILSSNVFIKSTIMYPFTCSNHIWRCNSSLYHISEGNSLEEIASLYSVKVSNVKPISRGFKEDYLVTVPCSCKDVNGTLGYFYDSFYEVQSGDTFFNVSGEYYSGQAWKVAGEEELFVAGDTITMHLICGCLEVESQEVVTYTVQEHDTLSEVAAVLSATVNEIENLNERLTQNPSFIDVGWVLFVPREREGSKAPRQGKRRKYAIIIGLLSAVSLISISALILFLLRRNRNHRSREKDLKVVSRVPSASRTSLQQHLHRQDIEATFQSERLVAYSLEEIDEATGNFDESRKIGEGGYGSVYIGTLRERDVAIKKMKSNKSKEFLAELKVLCKIHHINVVELLGYATGDDHLYLIYEYIKNGSLKEHLHDPLLKGYSPLAWTARALIALDAARGIEYIHDHTKARYVHRDIKTSNILIDQGLRAKVADFGLARLVERSNEDDIVATRLVGTPGYIAPESVRELQMTSKTDVYAFGVVLAELVTGQRALIRDKERNRVKSLASIICTIFNEQELETALQASTDPTLRGRYPMEEVYKMAELSRWCLCEEADKRPEMREMVQILSQIAMSSIEWEAAFGGTSQVFTGLISGR
ncbi:hypothetical protein ACOSQ2_024440 [Xanthoceras sorbifolium]